MPAASAGYAIAPEKPPFAVPSSLPFHAAPLGIQTSILICESGVGVAVAVTRQNGEAIVSGRGAPGGVNGPAGTSPADVMVTSGIASDVKDAHVLSAVASARTVVASAEATTIAAISPLNNDGPLPPNRPAEFPVCARGMP